MRSGSKSTWNPTPASALFGGLTAAHIRVRGESTGVSSPGEAQFAKVGLVTGFAPTGKGSEAAEASLEVDSMGLTKLWSS